MLKRTLAGLAATLAVLIAPASVSWMPGVSLHVTNARGAPVDEAYVCFHYKGYLLNPVHSLDYRTGRTAIGRAGADGRVTIPGRLHLRRPLPLSTPPRVLVDAVYVPRLHNAFGPLAESTPSRPGVFAVDDTRRRVTVFDVSHDPRQWEAGLRVLVQCVRETLGDGPAAGQDSDAATRSHARQLLGHVRAEYAALIARHGATRRGRPPAPAWAGEAERAEWEANVDRHLAREPLWGPYLQRMWRGDLAALDALERTSR